MTTGDTIPGKVRLVRVDTEGNREVVAGPYSTNETDDTNQTFTPEDYIYINTQLTDRKSAPLQAREEKAPRAEFQSGEQYVVEFQANSTVGNNVDHDFDGFSFDILRRDRNRGRIYPDTLTVSDQELSSDVTESATEYKAIFRETVPDRTEYRHAGRFAVAPVEN
jgi:hypothetical protein